MTTGELTDYTVEHLAMFGVTLRRNNCGRRGSYSYGIKDWPDLLGYDGRGRFWAIEIKNRETGDHLRGKQEAWMVLMRHKGCMVGVVACMEDVDRLVKEARHV
jgi:hypothetical protein